MKQLSSLGNCMAFILTCGSSEVPVTEFYLRLAFCCNGCRVASELYFYNAFLLKLIFRKRVHYFKDLQFNIWSKNELKAGILKALSSFCYLGLFSCEMDQIVKAIHLLALAKIGSWISKQKVYSMVLYVHLHVW